MITSFSSLPESGTCFPGTQGYAKDWTNHIARFEVVFFIELMNPCQFVVASHVFNVPMDVLFSGLQGCQGTFCKPVLALTSLVRWERTGTGVWRRDICTWYIHLPTFNTSNPYPSTLRGYCFYAGKLPRCPVKLLVQPLAPTVK